MSIENILTYLELKHEMKTESVLLKNIDAILIEYRRAIELHPKPMSSPHEGFAILKEEVDELWDEVKKKRRNASNDPLRIEARQVGAMALRFLIDLNTEEEE